MSMNFPSPAVPGQIYASPGGPVYRFDDPIWSPVPAPGSTGAETRRATVSPFDFGGVGDGVADDTFAIQQAIDFLFTSFGSGTVDMSGGRWLVDSADITMKSGVYLVGSWQGNVGGIWTATNPASDWSQLKSTIVLNPARTIKFDEVDSCGLRGLVILRKGLTTPTTVRQGYDAKAAFAGISATVGTGAGGASACQDITISNCTMLGFTYAIKAWRGSRSRFENVHADATHGIYIKDSFDMQHLSHCHIFPFVTMGVTEVGNYVVSGATNVGGKIRLTTATHTLVTGDIVAVSGVTGTTEANGRWTATVISSTVVELQGSIFTNAYVSGGNVNALYYARHGTGYDFDGTVDWGQADHCFVYSHDIGFDYELSNHGVLLNCGVDHGSLGDTTTIGFRIKDSSDMHMIGCRSAAVGTGIVSDVGTYSLVITGHDFWGIQAVGLDCITGRTMLSGSAIASAPVGIRVRPGSAGVHAVGNRVSNVAAVPLVIDLQTGTGARQSFLMGNDWVSTSGATQVTYEGRLNNWDDYSSSSNGPIWVSRKSIGTSAAPAAPTSGIASAQIWGQFWDGTSAWRTGGTYRIRSMATISPTSSPGEHVWAATATGAVTEADAMLLNSTGLFPGTNGTMLLGTNSARWASITGNYFILPNIGTAPATITNHGHLYLEGTTLKFRFPSGTIKTVATDP